LGAGGFEPALRRRGRLLTGREAARLLPRHAWAPDGEAVYATAFREEGTSTLVRLAEGGTGEPELVWDDLDGLARFNRMAVSVDGRRVYMALASAEAPDPYARHRPRADRDTDIYAVDVATGELEAVITSPGDDFAPQILGDVLYWTHNDYLDVVTIVPVEGGDPRDIVGEAQIPYWRPDGRQIAFTVGGWLIADWALNMDAWVVDVDDVGDRRSEPRPLIFGNHEDFTPAWSPDGEWLAYHSHRSSEPVSHYFAEGGTDDIYLRRADGVMQDEIRLMDFGWEVGMADWDRTGTRLFFDSWERGGQPGVSHPWIATIDTEGGRARSIDPLPLPSGFGGTVLAAWSPVADELAVVERIEGERHAVWVMAPDGSSARRLFEYRASTYGGVDWTPDGSRLIHGALSDGRMQLFSYDLASRESVQLTHAEDDIVHPQVSPDGRWIAASRLRHVKELRRMPVGG
jgi:Tol biopolymer transport system component